MLLPTNTMGEDMALQYFICVSFDLMDFGLCAFVNIFKPHHHLYIFVQNTWTGCYCTYVHTSPTATSTWRPGPNGPLLCNPPAGFFINEPHPKHDRVPVTSHVDCFYPSNPKSQSCHLLSLCIVLLVHAHFYDFLLRHFSVDNPPRVATDT